MIQANELRIGNLFKEGVIDAILYTETLRRCEVINEKGARRFKYIELLNPIPLTPEILEKCGFKITGQTVHPNNIWTKYGEESKFELEQIVHFFLYDNKCFGTQVNHLHQLQNLYFALTGEELTFKP